MNKTCAQDQALTDCPDAQGVMQPRVKRARGQSHVGAKLAAFSLAAISLLALTASPAAAATNGVVDVAAGNTLKVRSTPSSSGTQVGTLADGQAITLTCFTTGQSITGTFGTTTRWDKLSTGGYVSQAFVSVSGTLPDCNVTPPPATTGNALVDVAAGNTLTIRSTAAASGSAVGTFADNQRITVSCQTPGSSVSGTFGTTSAWYKVSNGYVSAAYVKADATPAACTTTTPPATGSSKAQTMLNYGVAQMAKPNAYAGSGAGEYNKGAISTVGQYFQGAGQSQYYLPAGKAGWDCSGFMYRMYQQVGISVPSSSSSIASSFPTVSKTLASLKPGDMLVYGGHHVVMYIGTYNGVPSIIEATPPTVNGTLITNGSQPTIGIKAASGYISNANYKAVRPAGI